MQLHVDWHEPEAAERVEAQWLRAAGAAGELTRELTMAGDVWWKRGGDRRRAEARYRQALSSTVVRDPILARLKALHEA
jgi:hypothetical protein